MSEDYQEHHVSTRVHIPVLLIDEGVDSAPVGLNPPPPPKAAAHLDTVRQLRDLIRDVLSHERPTVERLARRLRPRMPPAAPVAGGLGGKGRKSKTHRKTGGPIQQRPKRRPE
jgi:hypothetical protein